MCAVPIMTVFCSFLVWFTVCSGIFWMILMCFQLFILLRYVFCFLLFPYGVLLLLFCCHHHNFRHPWRIIKEQGLAVEVEEEDLQRETRIVRIWLPFSLMFKEKKKGRKTLQKQLRKVDVPSFISPTKCTVLIIYVPMLQACLRHVSVQVYHLQEAQCTGFKTSCQW
jgi:hypothetical protein